MPLPHRLLIALVFIAGWSSAAFATDVYTPTTPSPDGIGKVYMGREIAQVMGHQGASWLERSERAEEEGRLKTRFI